MWAVMVMIQSRTRNTANILLDHPTPYINGVEGNG